MGSHRTLSIYNVIFFRFKPIYNTEFKLTTSSFIKPYPRTSIVGTVIAKCLWTFVVFESLVMNFGGCFLILASITI